MGYNCGSITLVCILTYLIHTVNMYSPCSECTSADLDKTLGVCRVVGAALEKSEESKNSTVVCNSLHQLLLCIAKHVPQCLAVMGEKNIGYMWTPWDCHTSESQVFVYQEIVNKQCAPTDTDTQQLSNSELLCAGYVQHLLALSVWSVVHYQ